MVKINAAALTVASVAAVASAQDTCTDVSKDSLIISALASQGLDISEALFTEGSALSKCVGSLDTAALTKGLAPVLGATACTDLLNEKELIGQITTIAADPVAAIKDSKNAAPVCSAVSGVFGCLEKAALGAVLEIVNSQTCCNDFKEQVDKALGVEDQDGAEKLFKKAMTDIDNALCSTRPAYDDDSKNITCLEAMGPAFFVNASTSQALLKIPNDNGFDAYEGKDFETVDKSSTAFPQAYSGCAAPLDTVISTLAGMPIVAPLEDMFKSGKCMEAADAKKVVSQLPLIGSLSELFAEGCYHLANDFSKGAKWSVEATLASSGSDPDNKGGDDDDKKGSSKDNSGVIKSLSASAVAIAVLQYLL